MITRYLFKVARFILVVGSIIVLSSTLIDIGLKKTNSLMWRAWNDISSGDIVADIVIMGSSRAETQYHPQVITNITGLSTFNLGISGYGFSMQQCKYNYFTKYNRTPKYILLNIDPFSFGQRKNLYNWEQFLPYLKDPVIRKECKKYNGFSWADYYIPGMKYQGAPVASIVGISQMLNIGLFKTIPKNIAYVRGYHEQHENIMDDVVFEPAELNFNDTLILQNINRFVYHVKNEGTQVILVHAPLSKQFNNRVLNRDEVIQFFNNIAEQNNIPFLDYSNDSVLSQKKWYYDVIHLNANGSELFSAKLSNDLRKIVNPHICNP